MDVVNLRTRNKIYSVPNQSENGKYNQLVMSKVSDLCVGNQPVDLVNLHTRNITSLVPNQSEKD